MQARMKNPVFVIPGALEALQALAASTEKGAVPKRTLELVHLRASMINGCGVCLDLHARGAAAMCESDQRLLTIAGWRDAPYFTDAERARARADGSRHPAERSKRSGAGRDLERSSAPLR
jgi:AhpD family alkylhydroperoxidase